MLRSGILLTLLLLFGCDNATTANNATSLTLQLQFNGQPLRCDTTMLLADKPWQLAQFQLYLSDFSLNSKPLLLDPTLVHQQPQLALLGTVCNDASTDNWQLTFTRPLTSGTLAFNVGVPLARNHQDPLQAKPPLNQSDMYWSWQQGYKYIRLELSAADSQWALHLGATGCQSASPMRAPPSPCLAQNRPQIQLNIMPGQQLTLDLAPLLDGIVLTADNHCMADPNRKSCQTLLPRLGIGGPAVGWSAQ